MVQLFLAEQILVKSLPLSLLVDAVCYVLSHLYKGNKFVLFEDTPNYWDNWDVRSASAFAVNKKQVDIFHLEKPIPVESVFSSQILESGPLRVTLQVITKVH